MHYILVTSFNVLCRWVINSLQSLLLLHADIGWTILLLLNTYYVCDLSFLVAKTTLVQDVRAEVQKPLYIRFAFNTEFS